MVSSQPSRMPNFYVPPHGGPLRWQEDETGILPTAVMMYFSAMVEKWTLGRTQFALVRDYCDYYIHAPCWDANPYHDAETRARLARLRAQVWDVKTQHELDVWIHLCLEEGIDPL